MSGDHVVRVLPCSIPMLGDHLNHLVSIRPCFKPMTGNAVIMREFFYKSMTWFGLVWLIRFYVTVEDILVIFVTVQICSCGMTKKRDPLIIETTIGLVLGPCTALCRLFLKHCTLTNKAVGTIWRALSKPPQRRQGLDLRPLWVLVGTPSAIRPELAFSRAEHSLPYSDVTIYIFAILYLSSMPYV